MSTYVHLCYSTGENLIIKKKQQKHLPELKLFYVHSWDILCTPFFFPILEDAPKPVFQNSVFYVLVLSFIYIRCLLDV